MVNLHGLYPMGLVFASLIILLVPGILFVNFQNLGFVQASEPNLACNGPYAPGAPIDVTCQGTVATGCQSHTNCGLQDTNTVTFLNPNSPFTSLFTGNINAFFGSLTNGVSPIYSSANTVQSFSPFGAVGGGTYYSANCGKTGGKENWNSMTIGGCTLTTNLGNANYTTAASAGKVFNLTNWNTASTQAAGTFTTPFYHLAVANTTFGLLCTQQNSAATYLGTTNSTAAQASGKNAQGFWAYYGCDVFPLTSGGSVTGCGGACVCPNLGTVNTAGCPFWSFLVSVPMNATVSGAPLPLAAAYVHFQAYIQPTNWDAGECNAYLSLNLNQYASTQCTTIKSALSSKGYQSVNQAVQITSGGFISPVLAFLIGAVLLVMAFGLGVGANGSILGNALGFNISINPQGTRFAQILGVGLLIWSPLYSEFATGTDWFSALPNNLGPMLIIVITGMWFIGLFWQMWDIAG